MANPTLVETNNAPISQEGYDQWEEWIGNKMYTFRMPVDSDGNRDGMIMQWYDGMNKWLPCKDQ